jgi:diguanylate cyclase (GGDEF)-like protein
MDINITDLKDSNEFLKILLDNLSSAIFIVDKGIRIRSSNNSFQSLFHKTEDRILGELCGNALGCTFTVDEGKDCGYTSNCNQCQLRHSLIKSFTDKIPTYKEKLKREFIINGNRVLKYFQYTTRYVSFNEKEMVLIIVDDITELELSYQKMKEMAVTDGLTNLYNRSHIYQKLKEEIDKSNRYGNPFSIIMFDIDYFKAINDTYGHQVGDCVLAEVSQCIKKSIRKIDLPGRFGGEEFLVVLPQIDQEKAYITAERIRKNIESLHPNISGIPIDMTISGGVVSFHGETALQLVEKADKLLYRAKKKGKNRIEKSA